MSYNEDFNEEPEVIVKKKGGLLGKVVSLLLGVVIGAVGALGGTAGLGYYLATKKTIDEVLDYANVNESLYNEYISSEYTSKTLLDAILTTANVLIGFKDGTGTLGDLAAISPLIETKVLEFIESGKDAYGINFEYDEEHQIMNTPINEINQYIHDCILNTAVGDLFLKFGNDTDILDALCYGIEGEDYIVDENGEVQMLNGKTKMLVDDFADGGLTERINALPLDALMDVDLNDSTVCSVAYGAEHRYTVVTDETDGTKTVTMNQLYYTLEETDDGIMVYDDNGDLVNENTETVTYNVTKVTVSGSTAYVLASTTAVAQPSAEEGESAEESGSEQTEATPIVTKQLLYGFDKNGESAEDGKYYVYEAKEDAEGYTYGKAVSFAKTTVGDLQNDSAGIINHIALKDALKVDHNSHPILIALAYGEDFEYTYDSENNKTGITTDAPLRTVGDFRENSKSFIDEIALTSVITPKTDDKIIMYLLYGKQDVHYELNDGKVEMLQKQVAVDADGKVYNEYGERIECAIGTVNGYEQRDGDGNVLATYSLVSTGETLEILLNEDYEQATKVDLYYVSDENGTAIMYESTKMKDLSGDSPVLGNMTSRLTLGDVLDVGDNKILSHLTEVSIDELPKAVDALTVGDVFDEDMHYKNIEGAKGITILNENDEERTDVQPGVEYIDKNGNTVPVGAYVTKDGVLVADGNKSDALRSTWKYLIRTKKDDGSVTYHYNYRITADMTSMIENIEYNMQHTSLNEMNEDGVISTSESLRNTKIDPNVIAAMRRVGNEYTAAFDNILGAENPTLGLLTVDQVIVYLEFYMIVYKPSTEGS